MKDAFVVSLKTSADRAGADPRCSGRPTAYLLATRRFPGRSLAITLVELPLVLPPAVAGIGLLAAFGRIGLLGSSLRRARGHAPVHAERRSRSRSRTSPSPLYIRQAIAAFEATDPNLVAASRTLGAGPVRTFFRVDPAARPRRARSPGLALSFARGLGEFGATIMFAGSLQGVTQTLPLAIYAEFDLDFDATLAMGGVLVLISIVLLVALHTSLTWQRSPSTNLELPLRSFDLG